jgi:hypothetical protein
MVIRSSQIHNALYDGHIVLIISLGYFVMYYNISLCVLLFRYVVPL